jgi:hypothetical protein
MEKHLRLICIAWVFVIISASVAITAQEPSGAIPPTSVTTNAATMVTSSTATLNGTVNPFGSSAFGWFRYSTANPGTCNDSFGTRAPASSASDTFMGTGFSPVAYSRSISGLAPSTTYFFCAIARNSAPVNGFGGVLSFTTPGAAPTVVTNAASMVTSSSAELNGSANPTGSTLQHVQPCYMQ